MSRPIRFAFYGRVSTEDQQDPAASRAWEMRRAEQLIATHGEVVRVLRPRRQPLAAVARTTPGCGAPRRDQAARSRLRCHRDRRAAASVLRQPVRDDVPRAGALASDAVGARGWWADRPGLRGPRHDDDDV